MIDKRWGWVLVTVVAIVTVTAAAQDPQRPPVFRAGATAVSLDVSVTRGNRPVAGLTTPDFDVTDSGVPQTVEQAFTDVVPIDVTLVIDASGRTAPIFDDIRRNGQRILALLRPDDRARVLVSETTPYELLPLQPAGRGLLLPEQRVPGVWSSIHDAILAALVTRPDPDRRRLVVAVTGGPDNKSVTSVRALERAARRTDTVLHIITVRAELAVRLVESAASQRTRSDLDGFIRDVPTEQEMELFERLPALTGGVFQGPSRWGRNPDAVAVIREVIDEFRRSYVIQYTPRGLTTGGWHDLVVRVKGVDPKGVRARAGYFDTRR